MIAVQLRRMIRWQKLQRFRQSPRFAYRAAEAKAMRRAWLIAPISLSQYRIWFD